MDVKTCAMIPIDEHQDLKSTVRLRRIHRTQEVVSSVPTMNTEWESI